MIKTRFLLIIVIVGASLGLLQIWTMFECSSQEKIEGLNCFGIIDEISPSQDNSTLLIQSENSITSVYVEIADNSQERTRGLMFRENMDWNKGMFFVFDTERELSFWMKDTLIPLDMLFIDDDFKIIDIKESVPPCLEDKCPKYASESPAKYVLEVNAGFTLENNIKTGDNIVWSTSDN